MREGPICTCPECRKGEIFELDSKLYTCTSCYKVWDLEDMYRLLWLDRLQKLMERKAHQADTAHMSLDQLEVRIERTHKMIMELECDLIELKHAFYSMEPDPEDLRYKAMQFQIDEYGRKLILSRKRLEKYMKMRDRMTAEESI